VYLKPTAKDILMELPTSDYDEWKKAATYVYYFFRIKKHIDFPKMDLKNDWQPMGSFFSGTTTPF